jgi:hypothetical protein
MEADDKFWEVICKVTEMQNYSEFFFSFIYIWFDRAWKAGHE